MKKEIIRSTLMLLTLSMIGKVLSFIVRIVLARTLSNEAMSYYTLSTPTMLFLITLAQMGLPAALSKLIASKKDAIKPIQAGLVLALGNNLLLTILFVLLIPIFSNFIYQKPQIAPILWAIVPLIPLVTLSGILKGYFMGKQKLIPATASQISEESVRLIFLYTVYLLHPSFDPVFLATIAMLSISIGELGSILHLFLKMPSKKRHIQAMPSMFFHGKKENYDEILTLCLPMTGSRLIGSLAFFLEPFCLVLFNSPQLNSVMINIYSQLNGYVMPLITLPSFATITLANWLLPSFSYHYARNQISHARRLFYTILFTSALIGLACTFALSFFSNEICMLLYKQTSMAPLLKMLCWPFFIYTFQPALSSMLHAFDLSKKALVDTLCGSIFRLACILFLTPMLQAFTLPVALIGGMLITTLMHGYNVLQCLFYHK